MSLSRRVCAYLVALAALLFAAAPAAADDSALNKEGFWTVGRGEPESRYCLASIRTKAGAMLLLGAEKGEVTLAVGAKKPMRRGKKGVLTTEAYSFEFEPSYNDEGDTLFLSDRHADSLNARALAALRLAGAVAVMVDGRTVLDAKVEDTGLEGALDAVVACSNGKSGWWGPGVGAERIADGPVPNKAADALVYNKEGVWSVAVTEDPGICVAQAAVSEHRYLQILADVGQVGLAVGSDGEDLPRGRKGRVEIDAYAFDFKPQYGADSYVAADQPFDSKALSALARAKWIRVTVDRRELVDVSLEGTGFAEVLDSVAACSRSEKGWWGEGALAAR